MAWLVVDPTRNWSQAGVRFSVKLLRCLLAMTEITYSNSLIESWWRSLKHQWLYLSTLDTLSTLRKLITFYMDAHNTRLPHSAFRGQTPDEMYFGPAT